MKDTGTLILKLLFHPDVQPHRRSRQLLSGPKDVTLLIGDTKLEAYPKGATASEKQRHWAVYSASVCVSERFMNTFSLHWFPAAAMYIQCFVHVFVTYYLCFSVTVKHMRNTLTLMYLRVKNDVNMTGIQT